MDNPNQPLRQQSFNEFISLNGVRYCDHPCSYNYGYGNYYGHSYIQWVMI